MENGNIGLARRAHDITQVVQQVDFFGNLFDPRPEFAAFAEKVAVTSTTCSAPVESRQDTLQVFSATHEY
jgi:hypothetical protein